MTLPTAGYTLIIPETNTETSNLKIAAEYKVTSRTEDTAVVNLKIYYTPLTNIKTPVDASITIGDFIVETSLSGTVITSDYVKNVALQGTRDNVTTISENLTMNISAGSIESLITSFELNGEGYKVNAKPAKTLVIPAYTENEGTTVKRISTQVTAHGKDFVTLKASNLPFVKAYTINWYVDGYLDGTNTRSFLSLDSTAEHKFEGLVPNQTYTFNVVATSRKGQTLGSASRTYTTDEEGGVLALTKTSRAIVAKVSGMSSSPNYNRTVTFKLYSESTGYTATYTENGVRSAELTHAFEGLSINTNYSCTVTIKNGGIVLKTLSAETKTTDDASSVPVATITGAKQVPGSTNVSLSWISDKKAAGTTYTIEAYRSGMWGTVKSLTRATSPTEIEITLASGVANETIKFRIKAANPYLADDVTVSGEYSFEVVGEYNFDSAKISGNPLVITANEWNRLATVVEKKSVAYGLSISLARVSQGDPISANTFNRMKNAISEMQGINLADKKPGNPISAADINSLRDAINLA